jgi:hypothetical protein
VIVWIDWEALMIVSILMRKTRIQDRTEWEKRLAGVLPRVKDILKGEQGFVSVEYSWGVEDDGEMMQVTGWNALEDCQLHVRGGGAADIATMEDAVLPTAPFPDGAWVRKTFEVVENVSRRRPKTATSSVGGGCGIRSTASCESSNAAVKAGRMSPRP